MQHYRKLFQFTKPHWRYFLLIFVVTLLVSAVAPLLPWPLKIVVDHVLGNEAMPPWLERVIALLGVKPSAHGLLAVAIGGTLTLFVLNSLLDGLLTWSWTLAGRRMVYDLAETLYARVQRRSTLFHTRNNVGDLMGRVTVDSWSVYQILETLLFSPLNAFFTLTLMIILMSQLDPKLTVWAVVTAPLMVIVSLFLGKPLRAAAKARREIESGLQSHIQQTLSGMPVVQAFSQEAREQARFADFADNAIRVQQRSTLLGSFNSLSTGLVTSLGTGLILWLGAKEVANGPLTLGSLLVFVAYLGTLQKQTKVFADIYTALQRYGASVDRIMEVIDAPSELGEEAKPLPLVPVKGRITFDNVTFEYEPKQSVLNGVSFEINAGETIAIVGPTGAGKSTLVNLVPRFFDPSSGAVLLDGKDLKQLKLQELRENVSIVTQEPFLYPASIAENIALGKPSATRDQIEGAARAANAHSFIEKLPAGYDTVIGARGSTLSGGERQRLSIARALLKDAPILIMDEPTSALDVETEGLVLEAFDRLMAGRTTLIIAHRLSTVRNADRIFVLQEGQVAETGTHEELLREGGLYSNLYRIQFEQGRGVEGQK